MLRLCAIGAAALQAAAFTANPMSYGAVGDGVADDTTAVRAAAVAVAAAGGGTIAMLAPHQFLTGPFNLSSNSVLYVAAGAVLRASNDSSVYQLIPPLPWFGGGQDAEGSGQPEWSPVIASYNTTNVTITGGGLIDGNGAAWWSCFDAGLAPPPCNNYSRPQLVRPNNVTGFQMIDVTLQDSPAWTIHLAWVTGATIRDVSVYAPSTVGNTDGVDPDCSRDVLIENFFYQGGDDAIAIKSGINWSGRTFGRATENIMIRNMTVTTGNGFAVGSESSAGVNNVTFENVLVNASTTYMKHGLYVKSARGRGGTVSNIAVINTTVVGNVGRGHWLDLDYVRPQPPPTNVSATPYLLNVTISGGLIDTEGVAYEFDGLPETIIRGVVIDGVKLGGKAAGSVCPSCTYTNGTCTPGTTCPPCFTVV